MFHLAVSVKVVPYFVSVLDVLILVMIGLKTVNLLVFGIDHRLDDDV